MVPRSKPRPIWPASTAQAADRPKLARAWGSPRRDLALKAASGEPAGRSPSHLVSDIRWCPRPRRPPG
eukprot:scaffold19634_cov18-Phaeocystis_antarctica.AAC.1